MHTGPLVAYFLHYFLSIWKEGNDRNFKESLAFAEDILNVVIMSVSKWTLISKEFDNLNVDLILH